MLRGLWRYIAARVCAVAAIASFSLGQRCAAPAPTAARLDELAASLGRAIDGRVDPRAIVWEPGSGPLDPILGRHVLFLGASGSAPRELYRARVSVSLEGQPISIRRVENMSRTALADESHLHRVADQVAYFTLTDERITAYSVVDLSSRVPEAEGWSGVADRAWRAVHHGARARHVVSHFAFDAARARATLRPPMLTLELDADAPLELRLDAAELSPMGDVLAWRSDRALPARLVRARLLTELLPEPLSRRVRAIVAERQPAPKLPLPDVPARSSEGAWPPSRITPSVPGLAEDGAWRAVANLPSWAEAEGAMLLRTELGLDPDDARSRLVLIALDLRRLRLSMQGGTLLPPGELGPAGTGRPPREQRGSGRVLAVLSGGLLDRDYAAGFDGRVLALPEAGKATIATFEDGRIALGAWPQGNSGLQSVEAFRQSGELLVRDGVPTDVADSEGELVREHAALCRANGGVLFFAWSARASRVAFAAGLVRSGCVLAVPLDPVGFGLLRGPSEPAAGAHEAVPVPDWLGAGATAHDFIYLRERLATPAASELSWEVSPGVQPKPTALPAIHEARVRWGNIDIELLSVASERVAWTLTAGEGEPGMSGQAAPKRALDEHERSHALLGLSLGHTTRATRYGLAFRGRPSVPLRTTYATLLLSSAGLEVIPAGSELPSQDAHVVQLPQLVKDGQLAERGVHTGSRRRRGALCVGESNTILAAFTTHDSSAPLAMALRGQGCDTVVELDRASQHDAEFYREGTRNPVPDGGESTLLVAFAREMQQPTLEFD